MIKKTTINFEKAYSRLNSAQKEAVDVIEGPVMVLAGPGTGKTQVLAVRIGKILLETQINPSNILCLTFTETAATEMRNRLISLIGPDAYYVRIQTFHSFCNDVISDYPEIFVHLRASKNVTDVERLGILREIIDGLSGTSILKPFGSPYYYIKDIGKAISDLKREGISPEDYGKIMEKTEVDHDAGNFKKDRETEVNRLIKQQELVGIYRKYSEKMREMEKYDYEDMIVYVVEAFKNNKELLLGYQQKYQYVLVDEYQDTNGSQNEVISLLGNFYDTPNIFVVGDDDQSIFRFQGASLENILFFEKNYPGAKVIVLTDNYRSSQLILDTADSLISHNKLRAVSLIPRVSKKLTAKSKATDEKIEVYELETERSEEYFLASKVKELVDSGVSPSEIAVLFRNNSDAYGLVDLFLRMEIPFKLQAGKNILDDTYINQLVRFIKYLVHPLDNDLYFLLNSGFLNFAASDIDKITHSARIEKLSLWEQIAGEKNFADFVKNIIQWRKDRFNETFAEFFDHLIKESGYLKFVLESDKKEENLNRLNTLFEEIKTLNQNNKLLSAEEFLDYVNALAQDDLPLTENALETDRQGVCLMTVHRAKGTEFGHVFISQCLDRHWSNIRDMNRLPLPIGLLSHEPVEVGRNEEERRLFYVAMTRAKKKIYLTYAKTAGDKDRQTTPAMFLAEIESRFISRPDVSNIETESLERLKTVFLEPIHNQIETDREWVRILLKDYRLNVTDLNNFLKCPRLFYYQSLVKVPGVKSKHQALGTAVHCALRDWILLLRKEIPYSKQKFLSDFNFHLEKEFLGEKEFKEALEFGKKVLSDYFEEFKKSMRRDSLVEYDFSAHQVVIGTVPITGRFDRIDILDPKIRTIRVVDYKTGNPDSKSAELKPGGEYYRQIAFYQLLCEASPKFEYRMKTGQVNFIQKSKKTGDFVNRDFEISQEEINDLKTEIKQVYGEIKSLEFLDTMEEKSCGKCEFCEFFGNNK